MDFTTRQPNAPSTNRFASPDSQREHEDRTEHNPITPEHHPKPPRQGFPHKQGWIQGIMMLFLLCLVVLVSALLIFIASGNQNESKYVNINSYQVVEVADSGTQPSYYIGNITTIDNNYVVLSNTYSANMSSSGTNPVAVAPLVCASINNTSQLVLNRSRIVLWDNLSNNSDAAKAIQTYKANNPSGCPSNQNTANSTQTPSALNQTNPTSANSGPNPSSSANTTTTSPSNTPPTTTPKPTTPTTP